MRTLILGPGLLGGSLALALARPDHDIRVWGRRDPPLAYLRERHLSLHLGTDLEALADGSEFVILATPIGTMPGLLDRLVSSGRLASGAVITDVGSVKGGIVAKAETLLENSPYHFVGSHPMAGSEASGVEAARRELFTGATCILTPTTRTDADALARTRVFWEDLQCRVHTLGPSEHDRIVGHVSHVPHLLASLVVEVALGNESDWAQFSGQGLADTTRIASGEPGMWAEILDENHDAVLEALDQGCRRLETLQELLRTREKDGLYRFLLEAKQLRDNHIAKPRLKQDDPS